MRFRQIAVSTRIQRQTFMKATRAALVALTLPWAGIASSAESKQPLIVFAAASLTDAVTEIGDAFTRETGIPVKTSFAASSALARQVESGASAGVFFSADEEWMDYLEKKDLLTAGTRRDVLANRLVLVVPADSKIASVSFDSRSFLSAVRGAHIATGDPDSVPVGRYAKAALINLGAWEQIAARLVRAENVRSALAFVARGEAPFGIVYLTDAKIEKNVKLAGTFPSELHPPIRYPIAVTVKGNADAHRFVAFVSSQPALLTFEKHGFAIVR